MCIIPQQKRGAAWTAPFWRGVNFFRRCIIPLGKRGSRPGNTRERPARGPRGDCERPARDLITHATCRHPRQRSSMRTWYNQGRKHLSPYITDTPSCWSTSLSMQDHSTHRKFRAPHETEVYTGEQPAMGVEGTWTNVVQQRDHSLRADWDNYWATPFRSHEEYIDELAKNGQAHPEEMERVGTHKRTVLEVIMSGSAYQPFFFFSFAKRRRRRCADSKGNITCASASVTTKVRHLPRMQRVKPTH